ncbi:hypothetical protein ACFOY4_10185 [Actinomadura syzygii]|uniref:hypothetical protein n=1 Tax=Actinomadura syzygii TaxID=1427538 RepID=UPI001CA365CA|nr:hypothetical protein [Actinomadura syzygii]
MTAARPAETASNVLRALEGVWYAIRDRHTEIPDVVLILASGTEGKQARWGHHAPGRWHVADSDRTEIMVSGEGLRRTPAEVLGTLLHEATHALAEARDIQDTSRQGRYHNTRFRDLATELGIDVAKDDKFGWSITTVPDTTQAAYRAPLRALEKAMVLWRRDEITAPTATGKSSNLIAAICPCERTIRIARSSLEQAAVTCGACGGDFEPKAL